MRLYIASGRTTLCQPCNAIGCYITKALAALIGACESDVCQTSDVVTLFSLSGTFLVVHWLMDATQLSPIGLC